LICCLLPALVSCTKVAEPPAATGPTYSCCEKADVEREYRPGETLTVHWIVIEAKPSTSRPAQQVLLQANLTGPYADVATLKADDRQGSALLTLTAAPVRPSGAPDERPVSLIAIPAGAGPGFYNLSITVTDPGGSHGGASIIRVISAP